MGDVDGGLLEEEVSVEGVSSGSGDGTEGFRDQKSRCEGEREEDRREMIRGARRRRVVCINY